MEQIKMNLGKVSGPRGERGPQGVQGDPGFSPVISIVKDTLDEYILKINNKTTSYQTPNLIGNLAPVNKALNGLSFWSGTRSEYDAILTKDDDTIYFVIE